MSPGGLDFPAVLAHLQDLELPVTDYAVFGSGPMIVRGWIEATNDVDGVCRGAAWEKALSAGAPRRLEEWGVDVVELLDGSLTLGTEWAIGDIAVDEVIDSAELIDDVPYARLVYVVRYKRAMLRPKDLEHLAIIAAREIQSL